MLKSMRNCVQVLLLEWRTDKANDNFKKINRMKKFITLMILSALCLGAKAQYQVDNSDFEEGWDDVTYNKITGMEPKHWNSFLTGIGDLKSTACKVSQVERIQDDIRPGSTGQHSVKIFDYDVKFWGQHVAYAQGNLTTGCIKMGSMSASDAGQSAGSAGNYNFTDTSNDEFNQQFTGLPDAMHVWVKFVSTNSSYKAKATTILHTAGYYQDPAPKNNNCEGKVVANATKTDISSSSDWQELEIPFEYSITDGTKPAYALVSFSTNSTPGTGTGKDYMIIDDLEYIYYHSLSSCTYDGQQVTFDGNNAASVSALYDESKQLAYEIKGVGATVEEAYNKETGVLTITVKGNDYDADNTSVTKYTIQFYNASATLAVNSAAQYGTFCAPFDVTIPAGVTAYTISSIAENGKLALDEQQNTIPAHTPVIVYSESASGINEVQFGVATSGTATSDYLTGVYTDTTAPVGSYVLQNQSGRVGFYQVQAGTQPWVRANRAYLTVPASANVKAFYMDDATAIQTVEELLSGKAEIYDLAGRRQQKLQKGINIVGGKKVLVK